MLHAAAADCLQGPWKAGRSLVPILDQLESIAIAMNKCGGKRWLLLLPLLQFVLLGSLLQLPAAGGSGIGHVVTRMRGFDGPLPFYLETG